MVFTGVSKLKLPKANCTPKVSLYSLLHAHVRVQGMVHPVGVCSKHCRDVTYESCTRVFQSPFGGQNRLNRSQNAFACTCQGCRDGACTWGVFQIYSTWLVRSGLVRSGEDMCTGIVSIDILSIRCCAGRWCVHHSPGPIRNSLYTAVYGCIRLYTVDVAYMMYKGHAVWFWRSRRVDMGLGHTQGCVGCTHA
jgi:hypothetical protein